MVNPLNESPLAFPILESIHILGIICSVGTIALVSFRLLGIGLTAKSPAQLWSDTMPWTAAGLLLVIFSGLLLFSMNPDVYYLNYTFLFKMSVLVLAILFYYTVIRETVASPGNQAWVAACVSLASWILVLVCGIFIGLSATRPPAAAPPPAGVDFDQFLGGGPAQ
jgi:hypothetical protein